MNSTMEMTETMKKDNQFFGDFLQKEENPKECVIMGLIRTQKETLEDAHEKAKMKFADAMLEKDNWSMAKEREMDCNVLKGQISILNKLEKDFECIIAPKSVTIGQ